MANKIKIYVSKVTGERLLSLRVASARMGYSYVHACRLAKVGKIRTEQHRGRFFVPENEIHKRQQSDIFAPQPPLTPEF